MLSRKDSTQKYISIKEQKQKKYDNNITIIIYNEIKLVNQIAPISRAANIYSQHEHMSCSNGLYRLNVFVY